MPTEKEILEKIDYPNLVHKGYLEVELQTSQRRIQAELQQLEKFFIQKMEILREDLIGLIHSSISDPVKETKRDQQLTQAVDGLKEQEEMMKSLQAIVQAEKRKRIDFENKLKVLSAT